MGGGMDNFSDVINSIEVNIHNNIIASNLNRVCIIYLLSKCPRNELQAERIAYHLGVSHRTALYHLDILERHGFVEVRKYVRKGFSVEKLENLIKNNVIPR
jgi:DNA-binding transcriptional ArsR family regulator